MHRGRERERTREPCVDEGSRVVILADDLSALPIRVPVRTIGPMMPGEFDEA